MKRKFELIGGNEMKKFMEGCIKGALGMTGILLTIWFVKDFYDTF